jgi:hypothetical protein
MTPDESEHVVREHLRMYERLSLEMLHGAPIPERSPVNEYRALLRHGIRFTPAARQGVRKGRDKQCFRNSIHLIARHPKRAFIYCEGYAMRPGLFPIHHAWCTAADGTVVDATWADPEDCFYFGLPFKHQFAMDAACRSGTYGILHKGWQEGALVIDPDTPGDWLYEAFTKGKAK